MGNGLRLAPSLVFGLRSKQDYRAAVDNITRLIAGLRSDAFQNT